jgi:hypothetical protein
MKKEKQFHIMCTRTHKLTGINYLLYAYQKQKIYVYILCFGESALIFITKIGLSNNFSKVILTYPLLVLLMPTFKTCFSLFSSIPAREFRDMFK